MEKQELLRQEQKAFSRYYYLKVEGKKFRASYWYKKFKKLSNMRKLAEALVKRDLKANGITELNSIEI
jgi:hypothetical protein